MLDFLLIYFAVGFPEKYIPSFTWGGDKSSTVYDINKAMETAKIVMGRRKIDFAKKDELMFNTIFDLTKSDREKRGY